MLVHSSLSKLGLVAGGAGSVIEALLQVLGPKGTLLMPSFPFDTYVEDYLAANSIFNVRTTPSRMGAITEAFRLRPGVHRSLHPTHSVAAFGPGASYLTSTHHEDSRTFGARSPFHKLCERGGWILLVGVDFHSMTNLHVVEDIFEDFPYNVYSDKVFQIRMNPENGQEFVFQCRAHSKSLSALRDCNKMERYFGEAGALKVGRVGEAVARLMPAAAVLQVMQELATCKITMYDDERVPDSHRRVRAS